MSAFPRWFALFLLGLSLAAAGPDSAHAQKRVAAFIHGFSFSGPDDCVKSEGGERWKKSGTPDLWKNQQLIQDYVLLKYCDIDLYQNTQATMQDLTRQMQRINGSSVQWILVGHSQGGIVARLPHEHLRTHHPGMNIRGVVAMASPMQGARPSQLSYGSYSGHKNIRPVMDGFLNAVFAGPKATITHNPFARVINIATFGISGQILDIEITNAYWRQRWKLGNRVNAMNVRKRSKYAIGPEGRLIQQINRAPNPRRYRAVIGAERSLMAARLGSAGLDRASTDLGFTPWAHLGISAGASLFHLEDAADLLFVVEGRRFNPGDEAATVNFFNDLKRTYRRKADKYRKRRWFGFTCVLGDCKKYRAWKRGRQALNSIDRTHGRLIDSYRTVRRTGYRYVCPTNSFYPDRPSLATAKRINPEDCYYRSYTYYTTFAEKSDGLLGVRTCTWSPNQNPDDRRDNYLYGDNGRGLGGGTGYNHAEVVYERRRYNSINDPGIGARAFQKGQFNPPTRDSERWIRRQVF